jgi:hypothetical protein
LYVFVGLPLVVFLIAISLKGRGIINCVIGSLFGVVVGGELTRFIAHTVGDTGSRGWDPTRTFALGFLTALFVVVWARFGPDLRLAQSAQSERTNRDHIESNDK